jgi:hypothetical protein
MPAGDRFANCLSEPLRAQSARVIEKWRRDYGARDVTNDAPQNKLKWRAA